MNKLHDHLPEQNFNKFPDEHLHAVVALWARTGPSPIPFRNEIERKYATKAYIKCFTRLRLN